MDQNGPLLRVVKKVVLGNGGFVSCRKQAILTKTAKMTSFASYTQIQGFENGGCHSGKPWFDESGVFTTPIFRPKMPQNGRFGLVNAKIRFRIR